MRKSHFLGITLSCIVLAALILLFPQVPDASDLITSDDLFQTSPRESTSGLVVETNLDVDNSQQSKRSNIHDDSETTIEQPELVGPPEPELKEIRVRPNDTLSAIFLREGLSNEDLHEIQTASPPGCKLHSIDVGDVIAYRLNHANELAYFEYSRSPLVSFRFTRNDDSFLGESHEKETELRAVYHYVTIERGDSVISAGLNAGIREEQTIWQLAKILQWDIDFYHDVHPGDWYQILYEEAFTNEGEYLSDGNILAIEFSNKNKKHQIIRYEFDNGYSGYYSRDGRVTRKKFLRTPVEYRRVSSQFQLNRLHPILKVRRPHNGIDYAAPTGTPVYATGDGVVERVGKNRNNGNYIVLAHGILYHTKYLHLHRIDPKVKKGAEIKQGQRIGSVGMTGLATGPHLHYEFLVNGVHQNPATVHLPPAEPLSEEELTAFRVHAEEVFATLDTYKAKALDQEPLLAQKR